MQFFIGSLALTLPDLQENIRLQQFDEVFLRPVLPVTKQVTVQIEPVMAVQIPEAAVQIDVNLKAWEEAGRMCRAYRDRNGWSCVSRRTEDSVVIQVSKAYWEDFQKSFRPWFHVHLEEYCLENHAVILHSASIEYRGKGILFTAPSGTGKTTQTDLWHQYLKGVTDINADRTLLQKTKQGWYACGFPLYGSVLRCEQKAKPIKAIIILRQGKENRVEELSPAEKVSMLYSESTVPSTREYVSLAFNLLSDLIQEVKVIRYVCNMEKDAVQVLHRYLYGDRE
ncbi:MAG: hypothetical protein LUH07_15560 [Lachnospiraceae bacterium]|nr:hypothetical protein [Lachnospiraceae bacterium]